MKNKKIQKLLEAKIPTKRVISRIETQVVFALLLSLLVGMIAENYYVLYYAFTGTHTYFDFGAEVIRYFSWMGDLFMKLLKVFLGPLLFFSIFTAVIGLGDIGKLGKIGVRTCSYYLITTTLAIGLSLVLMNTIQPGAMFQMTFAGNAAGPSGLNFTNFILGLVPNNFMEAFVELNAMQIVTMGIILGIFVLISAKSAKKIKELKSLVDTLNNAILAFIGFVVKLTPFGVFGIVTKVIIENGFGSLITLLPFVAVVMTTLFIHAFISLPLLGYLLGKFNPYEYLSQVKEAILLGFSTSSSAATMPVSMKVAHEKAGLSKEVVDFTFPIGATVNMDGTAIYQSAVAIFVAQMIPGVDLSIIEQLTVVVIIIIASIGAAGVPGAGILILTVVFLSVDLPIEAIGVVLAIDRILDMFRTGVNVWGDLLTAKVVDNYYTKSLVKETSQDN